MGPPSQSHLVMESKETGNYIQITKHYYPLLKHPEKPEDSCGTESGLKPVDDLKPTKVEDNGTTCDMRKN